MEFKEVRFRHVGLSSDGAMIFCEMHNGKIYAMPLHVLDQAEDWDPKATPKAIHIIHDGYAAIVEFNTGVKVDFPSDVVLHFCEPRDSFHKDKGRAVSGVGPHSRDSRGTRLDSGRVGCEIGHC